MHQLEGFYLNQLHDMNNLSTKNFDPIAYSRKFVCKLKKILYIKLK